MTELTDSRLSPPKREVGTEREAQLAEMRGYRATYVSVVEKARALKDAPDEALVKRALDIFDNLEEEFLAATTDEARKNIVERAEEVEQSRAYIQPESELVVEANTLAADMTDWGVPEPMLQSIERDLLSIIKLPADKTRLAEKRSALNKLYQCYDAWSDHVTTYERWATRTAWVLGCLLVAGAVGCIIAIAEKKPLHAFTVAGFTGALLSVLGKFPPMLGWGQWASYTPRMLGRITTGIVTTLAGGALLALDVIRIGEKRFVDLFAEKPAPETRYMLLLVGLGIVFGFSERALVQFQDMVFKQNVGDKKGDP